MSEGSPFSLLARLLRRAAGISGAEPLVVRQQKLRARVGRHIPEADVARVSEFIGEIASVHFNDANSVQLRAARHDAMLMGDQMRRAFCELVLAESASGPLVLVLEDLHWGDLPSVTFIDSALRAASERPFMVLAIARGEVHETFPNLWEQRSLQEIRLGPLVRRAGERLVREVLGDDVDPAQCARLLDRAAGNVFYLEELIRAFAEGSGLAPARTGTTLPPPSLGAARARSPRSTRGRSRGRCSRWSRRASGARPDGSPGAPRRERLRRGLLARRAPGAHRRRLQGERGRRLALRARAPARSCSAATSRVSLPSTSTSSVTRSFATPPTRCSPPRTARSVTSSRASGSATPASTRRWSSPSTSSAASRSTRRPSSTLARRRRRWRATTSRPRGCARSARFAPARAGEALGRLQVLLAEASRWAGEHDAALHHGRVAMSELPHGSDDWYVAVAESVDAAMTLGLLAEAELLARRIRELEPEDGGAAGDDGGACGRDVTHRRALRRLRRLRDRRRADLARRARRHRGDGTRARARVPSRSRRRSRARCGSATSRPRRRSRRRRSRASTSSATCAMPRCSVTTRASRSSSSARLRLPRACSSRRSPRRSGSACRRS